MVSEKELQMISQLYSHLTWPVSFPLISPSRPKPPPIESLGASIWSLSDSRRAEEHLGFTHAPSTALKLLAAQPLGRKVEHQHSSRWDPGWAHPAWYQTGTNSPARCRLAVLEQHTCNALLRLFGFFSDKTGLIS